MHRIADLGLTLALLLALAAGCQTLPETGVSYDLARQRSAQIHDLRYRLQFDLSADREAPVNATETITCSLDRKGELVLDFREERPAPRTVMPQMMMGMAMAQASGGAMPMQDALSSGEASVRLTTEEAEEKSDDTMTEYVIPDRKSIRGNGEESLADLRNYIVPAKYHIVTAPKEDPGVFLMAEIGLVLNVSRHIGTETEDEEDETD